MMIREFLKRSALAVAVATPLSAPQPALAEAPVYEKPIVIGHRGASGFRPEHTLASYLLAIRQGADFIEPDLVVTRDGVLIARHEPNIGGTTDVADHPEFADRQTTKVVDGVTFENDWFAEDFTLAEIKTLRARERIPEVRPDNTRFDGRFEIPTLSEIIALVRQVEARTGKTIGIYPETKHPTYFQNAGTFLDGTPINLDISQMLIDTLVAENFTDPGRVFIQSFEFANLIRLNDVIMPAAGVDLPLVQLYGDVEDAFLQPEDFFSRPYDMLYNAQQGNDVAAIYGPCLNAALVPEGGITETTGYGNLISREAIGCVAEYAEGIGPWKDSFLLRAALPEPIDGNGDGEAQITNQLTGEVRPFLSYAFDAGLLVHPYTLRAEEVFLTSHPNGIPQTVIGEVVQLLGLGVNGFFIDQPIDGVTGRDLFLSINGQSDRPRFRFKPRKEGRYD